MIVASLLCAAFLIGCSSKAPLWESTNSASPPRSTVSLGDLVPAQSLPARDEELWIIEKPAPSPAAQQALPPNAVAPDRLPGTGMLLSVHGETLTPFPLEKTDVRANITGTIASVDVHQHFSNPLKQTADAVYAFSLPQNAAVNDFMMAIGKRHIRAIVRERVEAEQIYREAKSAGLLASLTVQKGPNVFLQRIANIEPGLAIDIELRYFHTIPCDEGWFTFEFPMVAGLRGQGVPTPAMREGQSVSLTAHIEAGAPIAQVECPTHEATIIKGETAADVILKQTDQIPNRDLLLRYRLAGNEAHASLFTEADGQDGTFALTLTAPSTPIGPVMPIELVIDSDGSIADEKVNRLVAAMGRNAVVENVKTLGAALSRPSNIADRRVQIFVSSGHFSLREALAAVRSRPSNVHLVMLSMDPSPDRATIDAIAHAAHAPAVYVAPTEDAVPILQDLIDRESRPAISNLEIDWHGAMVSDVFPEIPADLIAGQSVTLVGRYRGTAPSNFTVRGKTDGKMRSWNLIPIALKNLPGQSPLATIWARRKVANLAVSAIAQPNPAFDQQVRQLALEHGLISRYTSFVIVDAMMARTAGVENSQK